MTTNRTFSEAQLKYMAAVAFFDAVSHSQEGTHTDEEYCSAFQAKIDAQKALFAWCRSVVANDPKTARKFAANKADLDKLFENVWRFPSIRERLTDACLRLAA